MPKPKKAEKPTLMERAAAAMNLPGDIAAGLPRIEIIGNRQFILSNHKGLLEYGDARVDINGGRVVVRVVGRDLVIKMMSAGELMIEGQLLGVEFL